MTWEEQHLAGPFDMRTAWDDPRAFPSGVHFIGDYMGMAGLARGFAPVFIQARPAAKVGRSQTFAAILGSRGSNCLARRSPIGRRNIGRIRLGYTRRRVLRVPVRPVRRTRRSYRYCVKRSRAASVPSFRAARGAGACAS